MAQKTVLWHNYEGGKVAGYYWRLPPNWTVVGGRFAIIDLYLVQRPKRERFWRRWWRVWRGYPAPTEIVPIGLLNKDGEQQ